MRRRFKDICNLAAGSVAIGEIGDFGITGTSECLSQSRLYVRLTSGATERSGVIDKRLTRRAGGVRSAGIGNGRVAVKGVVIVAGDVGRTHGVGALHQLPGLVGGTTARGIGI